jgi:voltage-gated potassium channel Kch
MAAGGKDMKRRVTLIQRLRYEFDKTMSAGPIALIGWLAVLSLAGVLATAAVLTAVGAPRTGEPYSFPEAAWQALMHVIDTGGIESDQDWLVRTIGIAATVWGIFIVSSLIGLLGAGVIERLQELRKGRSLVLERGHTLILNWSASVFDIIQQLSIAAKEAKRRRAIVVMAPKDKVEMEDAIKAKVASHAHVSVICRSGDPTNLQDLQIANVDAAKSIIVISPDDGNPDVRNIKTVMALAQAHAATRRLVAEFRDSSNVEAVQVIAAQGVQAVMADDLISRIIVHSSRQSGLSEVYAELLSYEGEEICTAAKPVMKGLTYREALLAFEEGALIGLSIDGKAQLNPPMDTPIGESAEGVFIAATAAAIRPARRKAAVDEAAMAASAAAPTQAERALILGWNRRGAAVASELSYYMAPNSVMTIVADAPRFAQAAPTLKLANANVRLEHIVADTADRSVIRSLNASSCNHIIVLACSDDMDAEAADTQTLVTLLHLRQALADEGGGHITIVSEMLNERNRALGQSARSDDFIVSSRLISLMLTQISENEELLQIFAEILDEAGSEIYLRPALAYVSDQPVTFATVVAAAAAREESAFGYRRAPNGEDRGVLKLNPRKSEVVHFRPGDAVVVMAKGKGPDGAPAA